MTQHVLSHRRGLELFISALLHMGALCPQCGHGTRRTSKRWAKCKNCGQRIERRELPAPEHASE